MPKLSCWSCGRQIYTVAPLEALFAEERRCPRCGAFLNTERREAERRVQHRRVNPADDPGPPKPKSKPKPTVTATSAKTKGSTTSAKNTKTKAEPMSPDERRLAERRTARRRGAAKHTAGCCSEWARLMQLGFIGFGLIAGSIARAVRANPKTADWRMAAWSPSGKGPSRALKDRVVDVAAASPEAALADADLVILAAPATACLPLIDQLTGPWRHVLRPDAVVTDVASTKLRLVERADAAGLWYVGGHPMAGLETAGYGASDADLFVDRPWIVVPGALAGPSDVKRVIDLAKACRAKPLEMDAAAHDRAVAAISHLPLILAASLVEAVAGTPKAIRDDWPAASALAAGGWRDMTRVARGDPAMGAAIAVTNAPVLAARLRDFKAVLDAWLTELERPGGPKESALIERLAAARTILDEQR